jgi:hypothetical protein
MLTELSQRDDRWTLTNRCFSGPLGEVRRHRCPLLGGEAARLRSLRPLPEAARQSRVPGKVTRDPRSPPRRRASKVHATSTEAPLISSMRCPMPVTEATITCPECGTARREAMPENACQHFYTCTSCGTMLRPRQGDCCGSARTRISSARRSSRARGAVRTSSRSRTTCGSLR